MKSIVPYGLIIALFVGCGALAANDEPQRVVDRKINSSASLSKELKEIIVLGFYIRENEEEMREAKEDLKRYLEDGESVEDAFEEQFGHLGMGEERYNRSGQRFCRHVTDEETKSAYPVINPDLRVRLYDRELDILSEGPVRDEFPKSSDETTYIWQIIAYVPYHAEGYSLRLVRLENDKEILLDKLEFYSLPELERDIEQGQVYAYLPTTDGCFISPPMR